MTENSINEEPARDLTFAEMQKLEPLRQKREERWHQFRITGIHIFGMGLATIFATWSFHSSFSKASGVSDTVSQLPVYLVAPIIVGSVIALVGALLFARGQLSLNKSYREFDKIMAIIIANEQTEKNKKQRSN